MSQLQNADPLTALMYAVQVMNFLKMLILKTLKARQESVLDDTPFSHSDPSDENGHHSPQLPLEACSEEAVEQVFVPEEPILDGLTQLPEENSATDDATPESSQNSNPNIISEETTCADEKLCGTPQQTDSSTEREEIALNSSDTVEENVRRAGKGKLNNLHHKKGTRKARGASPVRANLQAEKSKGTSIITRINSNAERTEAWR